MQQVLLRLSKAAGAKAEWKNVKLSTEILNTWRVCLESVQTKGATNSTVLAVDLNLPSDTLSVATNDCDAKGFIVHAPSANAAVIYENPEERALILNRHDNKIDRLRVTVTDESAGAADRSAPDFTDITLVLRFDRVPDGGAAHRDLKNT